MPKIHVKVLQNPMRAYYEMVRLNRVNKVRERFMDRRTYKAPHERRKEFTKKAFYLDYAQRMYGNLKVLSIRRNRGL